MSTSSSPTIAPGDRIVVLGGSGFIGSHLVPALVEAGMSVVNYDLFDPPHELPADVVDIRGDIRDEHALTRAVSGADAVVNLAAAHHDFGITPATFESVNVEGARIISRVLADQNINNFCFYSSVAVYGESTSTPTEQTTPAPTNIYGQTKLEAEQIYRRWAADREGRRVLIVRPAVVFGPRNAANMYRLIDQIARRRFISVGSGKNEKSMIYVENIVEAIMFLWQRTLSSEITAVNLVDEPNLTSAEIIRSIHIDLGRRPPRFRLPLTPAIWLAKPLDWVAKLTGRDLPITSDRIAKLGAAETAFSSALLRDIGFTSPISLTEGITRMVKWYLTSEKNPDIYTHIPPEDPVIT